MILVPQYPSFANNMFFEFVGKEFADAISQAAWLDVVFPIGKVVNGQMIGHNGGTEHLELRPDDSFRSLAYMFPTEPMIAVSDQTYTFDWSVVVFANLDRIIKTTMPNGRYHAALALELTQKIKYNVWGFSKQLKSMTLESASDIFDETPGIDEGFTKAPFCAFRLNYEITISQNCITPVIPNIELCL